MGLFVFIGAGVVLVALLEELSGEKWPGKPMKPAKVRIQKIEQNTQALDWMFKKLGVEMKIKPSPENLLDNETKAILGLIWAVMLKFIKIGDDEDADQLNAKDALLLWCQNKCKGYPDLPVNSFKKDFKDGRVLCAIIHKHRPKMLDFDSLQRSEPLKNLKLAQDCASAYFDLEQYITPTEITKLDENSMVILVCDFYYGIAEQRKLDLAGRRIGKLCKLVSGEAHKEVEGEEE